MRTCSTLRPTCGDARGRLALALLVVLRDVSEHDRLVQMRADFIANASHELRTPLTVMRTAIDVVLAKPHATPDELVSMVAEVRQAVDHAERLIEALLVLARPRYRPRTNNPPSSRPVMLATSARTS